MIKWFGLVTIISCLTINLITGQLPFSNHNPSTIANELSTNTNGQDPIQSYSTLNDNVKGVKKIGVNQSPSGQQEQQLINVNPVVRSSNPKSDFIGPQNLIDQQQSNELAVKSQTKDDGEYKSLDEILSLAGLANVDALVPSSDSKTFMIKTRFKTTETSDKDDDDEKEEKEEKEVKEKKTTKKKSKKKSTKKSSKKSSKKSKKKSKKKKKKKKKKKSCCCCCC